MRISQGQERSNRSLQLKHRAETTQMQIHRIVPKMLDHVHPRAVVRGEVHVETFVFFQPRVQFQILVSGVVVDN